MWMRTRRTENKFCSRQTVKIRRGHFPSIFSTGKTEYLAGDRGDGQWSPTRATGRGMLLLYLWKGLEVRLFGDPASELPRTGPFRPRNFIRGAQDGVTAGLVGEGASIQMQVLQGMDNDVLGLLIGVLFALSCVVFWLLKLVLLAWTTSSGTRGYLAHGRRAGGRVAGGHTVGGGAAGREFMQRLRSRVSGGCRGGENTGGAAEQPATSVASLPPPVDDVCPICLTHFYEESLWHAVHVQTWPCSHWFCGSCFLTAWSRGSRGMAFPARCPVCRQEVRLLLASRPSERPLPPPEAEPVPEPLPPPACGDEGRAEGRRRRFSLRILGLRRLKASMNDAGGGAQTQASEQQRGLAELLPAGEGSCTGVREGDHGHSASAASSSGRQLGEQTAEQARAEADALTQVDKYNRLFGSAGSTILTNPLRWLTLMRWLVHELWSGNTDVVLRLVRNLRLIMFTIVVIGYILSPVDFFPESILGFVGLFDDLLFAIVITISISNAYREYVVARSQRNADIQSILEPAYYGSQRRGVSPPHSVVI